MLRLTQQELEALQLALGVFYLIRPQASVIQLKQRGLEESLLSASMKIERKLDASQ